MNNSSLAPDEFAALRFVRHEQPRRVTVNTNDYTPAAIFGNAYFNLGGWLPKTIPTITTQPTNKTVSAGSPAAFTVAAYGQPNPTFQWRKNGANISGATNAALSFASTMLTDNGTYSVIVSNSAGVLASSNAVLAIPAPSTSLTPRVVNGVIQLAWPATQTGFRLLAQTNPPGVGLTTNWQPVANSNATNLVTVPIMSSNGSVFYRLVYP